MTQARTSSTRARQRPIQSLDDLQPDPINATRGTDRGREGPVARLSLFEGCHTSDQAQQARSYALWLLLGTSAPETAMINGPPCPIQIQRCHAAGRA